MSWEATAYVKSLRECPDREPLSRGQKLLLFVLADYHNPAYRLAWPSMPKLAEEALTSLPQVKRDLKYLKAHGVIDRPPRQRAGRGAISTYTFVALDGPDVSGKRVHGEPFFSTAEKGSERVQGKHEKGSERVQGEQRNKERTKNLKNEEPRATEYELYRLKLEAEAPAHRAVLTDPLAGDREKQQARAWLIHFGFMRASEACA